MGLAASQARFLGITLRKANCEFKSTELAQQRLELTNQMTDIAQDYANSMNATKLVWHNDMVCDSFGNPMDYGLSYSLLMMPSAANDYNPYMFSTRSGAIVLNSKYAEAAKAAGISEGGGTPSAEGRKKFLASLANGKFENGNVVTDENGLVVDKDKHDNVITKYTYDILEQTLKPDGKAVAPLSRNTLEDGVKWHSGAGMGAKPLNKADSGLTHLSDLVKNSSIGGKEIDWLQIERAITDHTYGGDAITTAQLEMGGNSYKKDVINTRATLRSEEAAKIEKNESGMTSEQVNLYSQAAEKAAKSISKAYNIGSIKVSTPQERTAAKSVLEELAALHKNGMSENTAKEFKSNIPEPNPDDYKSSQYINGKDNPKYKMASEQYEKSKDYMAYAEEVYKSVANFAYLDLQQKILENEPQNEGQRQQLKIDLQNALADTKSKLCYATYKKESASSSGNIIGWEEDNNANIKVKLEDLFNISDSRIVESPRTIKANNAEVEDKTFDRLTLAVNDVICNDASAIKSLTIGDLLTQNVVLTTRGKESVQSVGDAATAIMEYIGEVFGVNNPGAGLNVDDESANALQKALSMVKKLYLNQGSAVAKGEDTTKKSSGLFGWGGTITTTNDTALNSNQAYVNANNFNRIGTNNHKDYAAVNISNMVSAFLTYYDNYLRGSESSYIVGKGNTDGKTVFVTDDPNYVYVASNTEALTNDEKIADFFNQLYNNICEHGWRYDDMVQDSEHLESAIKDGRYQIMELNTDGYFYQMRYNDIGYMEEVQDQDAIARAESNYQIKKAQITFKEDQIDVKTKKLDAEITELNTEINSVQNIISKNIEKTFTMFSN